MSEVYWCHTCETEHIGSCPWDRVAEFKQLVRETCISPTSGGPANPPKGGSGLMPKKELTEEWKQYLLMRAPTQCHYDRDIFCCRERGIGLDPCDECPIKKLRREEAEREKKTDNRRENRDDDRAAPRDPEETQEEES